MAQTAPACISVDPDDLELAVEAADLIVIGQVDGGEGRLQLAPDAYLKGPATGEALRLEAAEEGCLAADLEPGTRVLAFVVVEGGQVRWPNREATFVLDGGRAIGGAEPDGTLAEAALVASIRSLTGQYAVPALGDQEGAGIEWLGTVAWVTGALVIVFVLGLVLMRVWHRIDPS